MRLNCRNRRKQDHVGMFDAAGLTPRFSEQAQRSYCPSDETPAKQAALDSRCSSEL